MFFWLPAISIVNYHITSTTIDNILSSFGYKCLTSINLVHRVISVECFHNLRPA